MGCSALQMSHLQLASPGEPVFFDLHHTTSDSTLPPLVEEWYYNAGAGFGEGPPILLDDLVMVATRKGEIHAVDFNTGKRAGVKRFGDVIEATPAFVNPFLIVPIGWGRQALVVYSLLRSAVTWQHRGAPVQTAILPMDDALIAVDTEATVRKYELQDGTMVWEHMLGETIRVHSAPLMVREHIIVADDQGSIVALHPDTGEIQWSTDIHSPVYTSVASEGDMLYIPTTRGRLVALDGISGTVQWEMVLPDTTVRLSSPAVDGDIVIVGGSDGNIRALSPSTGETVWIFEAADALTAAPLLTPAVVYVGSMGGILYALHRETGELWWHTELRGRVKSAMEARDGYLLVLSEPRYLYLFRSASMSDG